MSVAIKVGVTTYLELEIGVGDALVTPIVGLERIGKTGLMPLVGVGQNFADRDCAPIVPVQDEIARQYVIDVQGVPSSQWNAAQTKTT